jgi:hypothetical protein
LLSDKNVYFIDRLIEISGIACLASRRFHAARAGLPAGAPLEKSSVAYSAGEAASPHLSFLKSAMMMLMIL